MDVREIPDMSFVRSWGGMPFKVKGPVAAKAWNWAKAALTWGTKRSKWSVERKGQADVEERGLCIKAERYFGAWPIWDLETRRMGWSCIERKRWKGASVRLQSYRYKIWENQGMRAMSLAATFKSAKKLVSFLPEFCLSTEYKVKNFWRYKKIM